MINYKLLTTTLLLLLTFGVGFLPALVSAQTDDSPGIIIDPPNNPILEGIQPIKIPTFLSLEQVRSFSIFSYVALGMQLLFFGIFMYWIFLVFKAAVGIIKAQGESKPLEEGGRQFGAVFWSITFMIGFFAVLMLTAAFFGFGSILEWPKMFSRCTNDTYGQYYFQVVQRVTSSNLSGGTDRADSLCF